MNLTQLFDNVDDAINDIDSDIHDFGWAEHERLIQEGEADIDRLRHEIELVKEHLRSKSRWGVLEC